MTPTQDNGEVENGSAHDILLNKDEAASFERIEERGDKSRGIAPIAPAPHV